MRLAITISRSHCLLMSTYGRPVSVERHFIPTEVQIAVRPHHRVVPDEAVAAERNGRRRAKPAVLLLLRYLRIPRGLIRFVLEEGRPDDDAEFSTGPRLRIAVARRRRQMMSEGWCDLMTRSAFARLSITSSVLRSAAGSWDIAARICEYLSPRSPR